MKDQNKFFMTKAIDKAKKAIIAGQTPFGACVVKDGKIISCEHNHVWKNTDITAHAEIQAIRKACKKLNSVDLSGCIIYSTCEPCPMCFSAIHWSRISKIYYGASIMDAQSAGFNELDISNKKMKKMGNSMVEIESGLLKDQNVGLFELWKKNSKNKTY